MAAAGEEQGNGSAIADMSRDVRILCKQGRLKEALRVIDRPGIRPDFSAYPFLLDWCLQTRDLAQGKLVHAHMIESGFNPDIFLGTKLVTMYAKCGSLVNARQVFDKMPERNVVSWTTMISAYVRHGYNEEALGFYYQLQRGGIQPNTFTFSSAISACANMAALKPGRAIHRDIHGSGFQSDTFVGTALVDMYAKCGNTEDAFKVFDKMPERNLASWNALIAGYAENGQLDGALKLFQKAPDRDEISWKAIIASHANSGHFEEALNLVEPMRLTGLNPESSTYARLLQECANDRVLPKGKLIHAHMIDAGFDPEMSLQTKLVIMYAKCGKTEDARQVFDKMPERNVISWNALISGYAQNGRGDEALDLFHQMPERDVVSWNTMIAQCAQNGQVDGAVKLFQKMAERDMVSWNTLIAVCAQNGEVGGALKLFQKMPERGIVSWNAMIAGYVQDGQVGEALGLFQKMAQRKTVSWTTLIAGYTQNGYFDEALNLFQQMQLTGVKPDAVTFTSILPACAANLKSLKNGREVHESIVRNGFQFDISVCGALVDMYAKCGSIQDACQVFEEMPERNVVSWNRLIAGYAQNGQVVEALKLFQIMPERDVVSWNVMITGYVQNGHVDEALKFFQKIPEQNVISSTVMISGYVQSTHIEEALKLFHRMSVRDIILWNAMIAGYAQNGQLDEALKLFQKMLEQDITSWNVIIIGYANNGQSNEALKFFRQMQLIGVKPDSVSFTSILPACANLTALINGKEVHGNIIRNGFQYCIPVGSSLVDMYAKCGTIWDASEVFDKMLERDILTWNVMIIGYANHGHGKEALHLFEQMQESGMKPDHVTFIGVLSACSHAGLVDDGWQYFRCMSQDYHITPVMEHYSCMVDLLGRAGHLYEAQGFINEMPIEPNAVVWQTLLSACRIHNNIQLGECVAEQLFELDPKNASCYVLLSNIYAAASRWDDVEKVRNFMKDMRVKKNPGCSWIETNIKACSLPVRKKSPPQISQS